MSFWCRFHGEDLHRLQTWNLVRSLGWHHVHASPAECRATPHTLQCLCPDSSGRTCRKGFYSDLRRLLQSTPAAYKVMIIGDFNARVGRDSEAWKGVLGRHGVGNCNDNGRLPLEFCSERQITITNTVFQQRAGVKTTWMHPRSKHWYLLDYILVRRCDLKDVLSRMMPSAECHTDHRLVRCKLNLQFKLKPKKSGPRGKNSMPATSAQLKWKLIFSTTVPFPEALWDQLKTAILETTVDVFGHAKKKNKDWFDENDKKIQQLLAKKRSVHQAHLAQPSCPVKKASFRRACSVLQCKLREIQNEWWNHLARGIQLFADTGDYGGSYEASKTV